MGDMPPGDSCIGRFNDPAHIVHGEYMALVAQETAMNTDPTELAAWFEEENRAHAEEQEILRQEFGGDEHFFADMAV
ncbi:hypothetical protein ACFY8W_04225 [Streptomyces sp. NPDC012637]|uniref:hypothetical protein n=1 Tax=Streptomyces sp. NPDC012637 TaxID=3364842 RepID=UPI0036ED217E